MKPFAKKSPKHPVTYGYARVSSAGQNIDRQLDALRSAGVEDGCIFTDRKSGKDFDRPGWTKLERRLRKGDTLVICSLDRLGRDYTQVLEEWRHITKEKEVSIRILDMPVLNTCGAYGLVMRFIVELILRVLAFVAECERKHIRERQREGIEAAKRRGVRFGRPSVTLPQQFDEWAEKVAAKKVRQSVAANECGMSPTTFRRYYTAWKNRRDTPDDRLPLPVSENPPQTPRQKV
ncbi:MAG: recombinase family protein [Kiritimatiellae bacterium]|nr:recombinase family protein [Kiritimatiellia bacterium]